MFLFILLLCKLYIIKVIMALGNTWYSVPALMHAFVQCDLNTVAAGLARLVLEDCEAALVMPEFVIGPLGGCLSGYGFLP